MHTPARWNDDPACGHLVAYEHQTHYCTYIRVPKLLTLQHPTIDDPDAIHAWLIYQTTELWFRVMIADLGTLTDMRSDRGSTALPMKLLQRTSQILQILMRLTGIAESILHLELQMQIPLDPDRVTSQQYARLKRLFTELETAFDASKNEQLTLHSKQLLTAFHHWVARFEGLSAAIFTPDQRGRGFDDVFQTKELLTLQNGVKADWTPVGEAPAAIRPTDGVSNDELMFIVVHQAFELMFRAILHELDTVHGDLLSDGDLAESIVRVRRVNAIEKLLVEMIHIPATMLPMDFLQFREQEKRDGEKVVVRGLSPASGTESYQFREIEILSGLKTSVSYEEFLHGNPRMHIRFMTPRQGERIDQPCLSDLFEKLLTKRGVDDLAQIFQPAEAENPYADLAELADQLLEFDEFFQQWRMNHLTMVQSMIGRKSGTGFLGPEYLKETLGMGMQGEDDRLLRTPQIRPRFFEELWEVRTRLERTASE
jgi:tryptophan 2,3-dioxygenase